jgi:hypothetical protein
LKPLQKRAGDLRVRPELCLVERQFLQHKISSYAFLHFLASSYATNPHKRLQSPLSVLKPSSSEIRR